MAALLLAGHQVSAHDLAYKIPKNAYAVVSVRTDQLFNLLSIQEFNQSALGRKVLSKISGADHFKLQDMGIDLSSPVYYYYRNTDSVSYHCMLIPMADAVQMDRFVQRKSGGERIQQDGERRMLGDMKDGSLFMWNDRMALMMVPVVKDPAPWPYAETTTEEMPVAVDSAVAAIVEVAPPPPPRIMRKGRKTVAKKKYRRATAPRAEEVLVVEAPAEDNEYARIRQRKDSLARTWGMLYAEKVFNKTHESASILDNEAYIRSIDKNAVAAVYLASAQDLYTSITGSYFLRKYMGKTISGYGPINARLYLDQHQARLTAEMALSNAKAAAYSRIYNHRMNKDFLKYVNNERMIAFMGYSMDTRAYLDEFPKLMEQTYGQVFGLNSRKYREELSLASDLFSLLLDEEAVAQVIKGDGLVLLNGLSRKTVTYTTYEYNDNYERKEVEKTKTETLPDFLFMCSSDDTRLIRKLLKYGIEKEQITLHNGIYTFNKKAMKSPLPIHLLIKDGIIFVGTSIRDMQAISTDTYESHVSRAQRELIMDNNMSFYFDPYNLRGKFSQKEIGSVRNFERMNRLLGNSGVFYARSNGIEGNYITTELVAEVPEGNSNALQYFFSLVNDLAKD